MKKKFVYYLLIALLALLSGSGIAAAQPLAGGECSPPRCGPPPYWPPPYWPPPWYPPYYYGCPYLSECRETPGSDADKDSVPDWVDRCPSTTLKSAVDKFGCPVAEIPKGSPDADNDGYNDNDDWCPGPGDQSGERNVDNVGCPTDGGGGYNYIVQKGDWWYKIARRSGICLKALWEANPDLADNWCCFLHPGEKVWILPKSEAQITGEAGPDEQGGYWYTVQYGDWWYKISRYEGVSVDRLMAANPNKVRPPCYWLYAGEQLWIPRS